MRFGLPTMPAELSLYLLNFVDRIIIVRSAGLAEAGLYSLAVKFAQAVNVLVRGFQLAWPPLAYSIRDDDEARRAYAAIVTWFVAGCAFVVTGMWLLSRWIVRALAAPEFFGSYKAIGLISTAVTLYALYMVLVVILGRTGRTGFNFPAAIAALVVNVALNLALVPPLGIVGAGIALVASYLVVLALMYGFTQRLFPVPYEWGRLARVVLVSAVLVGAGELLMPTSGFAGLLGRGRPLRRLTRCSSSPAASSPPASAAGWPACATRSRWQRPGGRCGARPAASNGSDPRGLRGRAHGRGRPPLRRRSLETSRVLHSGFWPEGGSVSPRLARGKEPGGRGR